MHVPLRMRFAPNLGDTSFLWRKSFTNCDAHLPESNFQTRSGAEEWEAMEKKTEMQRETLGRDKECRQEECAAVLLAAGRGTRMQSGTPKQYMLLGGKPLLYYALKALQESFVRKIVLVASEGELAYCQEHIVQEYGFDKVTAVVAGGKERYHSVQAGLNALGECDYVLIHDGARPFVTREILERVYSGVRKYHACVAGMPVKDTIKIVDEDGFASATPKRDLVWTVQTPQAFSYDLIREAYVLLAEKEGDLERQGIHITDDAMVVETFTKRKVKLVEGSYQNIKLTTPEDLLIAEAFLS